MWMCWSAAAGMTPNVSSSGPSSRSGARTSAPCCSSPLTAPSIITNDLPRTISGMSGIGGIAMSRMLVVTSRGASAAQRAHAFMISAPRSTGQAIIPAYTVATGYRRNSSAVTTPKLPPPPRTAQNSSGSWSASVRTWRPSAVTSSIATMLFVAMPYWRAIQPMPPPSE